MEPVCTVAACGATIEESGVVSDDVWFSGLEPTPSDTAAGVSGCGVVADPSVCTWDSGATEVGGEEGVGGVTLLCSPRVIGGVSSLSTVMLCTRSVVPDALRL